MAPIIIIGSGLAGYTLAREVRKMDKETPLHIVTADDGRYYSKPQLSNAITHGKTATALGMFTATQMAKQLNAEISTQSLVTAIDPQNKQITINKLVSLAYAKLVLACGAHPVSHLQISEPNDKICTVNNLQDYEHFRQLIANKKHITIIGAGLVGCEFASDLYHGGYQVTVIAPEKTPLARLLPPQAGQAVQQALAEQGVEWLLKEKVERIISAENQLEIHLASGKKLSSELILSATGLRAGIELAAETGLVTRLGIVVDDYLQTSQADIYALGDCAEVMGFNLHYVMPLALCARALAHTLTGQTTAVQYPAMPIYIKIPACPVIILAPANPQHGEWQISGEGQDVKCLFYNSSGQLQGFALTGKAIAEKDALIAEIPPLLV